MAQEKQCDNEDAGETNDPKPWGSWVRAVDGQGAQGVARPGTAGPHVYAHRPVVFGRARGCSSSACSLWEVS